MTDENGNPFYTKKAYNEWKKTQPKAPRQGKVIDPNTLVKCISTEVALFQEYIKLDGKDKSYHDVCSVYNKLEKAIYTGAVDSSTFRELLVNMRDNLFSVISQWDGNSTFNISVSNYEKYREIAKSENLFQGVTLIAKYQRLTNMNKGAYKDKCAENLVKAINDALDKSKVEDEYTDILNECAELLQDYVDGAIGWLRPVNVPYGLNGFGLVGIIADEILDGCDTYDYDYTPYYSQSRTRSNNNNVKKKMRW